ncbi:MAG: nucleoside hydrolase [Lachnospiraceae bacterium]|nr:nucleoside hydrolase [Lachnospiraceae bacterium]
MKKTICILLSLMLILLTACSNTGNNDASAGNKGRKIIIDTDTGADDAAAIILAAKDKDIEILGLTVLVGNVDLEQSTKNAIMSVEVAGKELPVYKGADTTLDGEDKYAFSVFGEDGMGDTDLVHPTGKAEDKNAIDFILDSIKQYPGEVEIIALGPATNIAQAIEKDPITMMDVKRIWSLGTAGFGPGNASPVAEFNVYADADAYNVMLDSGLPITVVGLDMCGDEAAWTDKQFAKLEKTNDIGSFVTKSFGKIREFYNENGANGTVMVCDPICVMCALYPDFVKGTTNCYGSCITDDGETYGQVLFYRDGFTYDATNNNDYIYNVQVVTDVDKKGYFDRFLKAIK